MKRKAIIRLGFDKNSKEEELLLNMNWTPPSPVDHHGQLLGEGRFPVNLSAPLIALFAALSLYDSTRQLRSARQHRSASMQKYTHKCKYEYKNTKAMTQTQIQKKKQIHVNCILCRPVAVRLNKTIWRWAKQHRSAPSSILPPASFLSLCLL